MTTLSNWTPKRKLLPTCHALFLCCTGMCYYLEKLPTKSDRNNLIMLRGKNSTIYHKRSLQGGNSGNGDEYEFGNSLAENFRFIFQVLLLYFGLYFLYICALAYSLPTEDMEERGDEVVDAAQRANRNWLRSWEEGQDSSQRQSMRIASGDQTNCLTGKWKGYFHSYGSEPQLFQNLFTFDLNGTIINGGIKVQGSGTDHVGEYKINGLLNEDTGRLAFTMQYQQGSQQGIGNPNENLEGAVECRGIVQSCVEADIQGRWFVRTRNGLSLLSESTKYRRNGVFHIWPCDRSTCNNQSTETTPLVSTLSFNPIKCSDDNSLLPREDECVVCFLEDVETVLRPCGHIALCTQCANQLDKCPLCRRGIHKREPLHFHNNDP